MLKNNIEVSDELKKYINLVEKVETKNENVDLDLVLSEADRLGMKTIKMSVINEIARITKKTPEEVIRTMYPDYVIIDDTKEDKGFKSIGEILSHEEFNYEGKGNKQTS